MAVGEKQNPNPPAKNPPATGDAPPVLDRPLGVAGVEPVQLLSSAVLAIFGVVLPMVTLGYEVITRGCATLFFDPLPSWWNAALVTAVPLAVAAGLVRGFKARPSVLAAFSAFATGVAAVYALAFLPIVPLALVGVLLAGLGLFPLAPYLAVPPLLATYFRARREAGGKGRVLLGRFLLAFSAGVAATLAVPIWNGLTTAAAERVIASQDTAGRDMTALRWLGREEALRALCYSAGRQGMGVFMDPLKARRTADPESYRALYFRVTGQAFNAKPMPDGIAVAGRNMFSTGAEDSDHGGDRVAGRVPGLSLVETDLRTTFLPRSLATYTEWTMVFRNVRATEAEARALMLLPPGGAVTRAVLWIHGEPREAAFGGTGQVRAAYREVAVVQRRDPLLVTAFGPDRALVQCFPVPARGEMKIRVGITAPILPISATDGVWEWPQIVEENFAVAPEVRRTAAFEGEGAPQAGSWQGLRSPRESRVRIAIPASARDAVASDPFEDGWAIRQTLRKVQSARPARVVWVIDGSREAKPWKRAAMAAAKGGDAVPDLAVFAGDTPEVWRPEDGDFGEWIGTRTWVGGRDAVPALDAALGAIGTGTGAVLWLRAPQPVPLSDPGDLAARFTDARGRVVLHEITVRDGPDAMASALRDADWRRVRWLGSPRETLEGLLAEWRGEREVWEVSRWRVPVPSAMETHADGGQSLRLWGLDEVGRLRREPAGLEQAVKLGISLGLVTPVTGAVVLETQEQYQRHGLTPADSASAPTIPEPNVLALAAAGAAWLVSRRRFRHLLF